MALPLNAQLARSYVQRPQRLDWRRLRETILSESQTGGGGIDSFRLARLYRGSLLTLFPCGFLGLLLEIFLVTR
jgi:hypothetical protein